MSIYCFNCTNTNHGFKFCKMDLNLCDICHTKGHMRIECKYFNTLCYRCAQNGKEIKESECNIHKDLKRCGAIIVDNKLNILIVQNHSGIWSIPKGHQSHSREPYTLCAMREVYEETGLKLKINNSFKKIKIGNIIYFLISLNDFYKKFLKIRDTNEVKQMCWINIKDILRLENINWSLRQIGSYLKMLTL